MNSIDNDVDEICRNCPKLPICEEDNCYRYYGVASKKGIQCAANYDNHRVLLWETEKEAKEEYQRLVAEGKIQVMPGDEIKMFCMPVRRMVAVGDKK